jgi:hypothetical protein
MTDSGTGNVTVLYIMGLWRSGSTILDILLGNHAKLASVGELRSLPATGWLRDEVCACGAKATDCEFWSAVRAKWQERVGGDKVVRLVELQNRFERMRSLPRLLAATVARTADFREYKSLTAALYHAIADVSNKQIVVDSTKYPARALALLSVPGIDLRLLHLVRDGRAVTWSIHRMPNVDLEGNIIDYGEDKVAGSTARAWRRVNLFSSLLTRLSKRSVRVRYEDLVTQPERELQRIGDLIDVDMMPLARILENETPLEVTHMVAGNRVRHQKTLRLKPDLEWREKLSERDRHTFWKHAGWLAKRYGYQE